MKMLCLVVVFLSVFSMALGEDKCSRCVTFAWDYEEGVLGYKLHYGTKSGKYNRTLDLGLREEYTVKGLKKGETYYFSLTSYFSDGQQSDYSDEIVHTIK
jgi:hypothetical protein